MLRPPRVSGLRAAESGSILAALRATSRGWSAPGDPDTNVNGIDSVRAYLVDHFDGCDVAPFTDALTHTHGTVGFNVLLGDSLRTVEVAYELLESTALAGLDDYLDQVGLVELLRAIDDATILVTPEGAHPIEVHAPHGPGAAAGASRDAPTPNLLPPAGATAGLRLYLIVEDDPDVAAAVGGYLQARGGMVCRAVRIDEAERILADLRVDGIVVDVQLPDGDGLEWLVRLVRSERGFGGRIVLYSGRALPDERLDELERSGAVFLEKPCALADLAEALGFDRNTMS